MIDWQGLLFNLWDAFAYAVSTALMVVGLCVVALIAYRLAR